MAPRNPISTSVFLSNFRRAWDSKRALVPWDQSHPNQSPTRIGLAVSGGADSMALAYLVRELERTGIAGKISVTAFVVDHKARVESSLEASTVAGWLAGMGINTSVLELDWSSLLQNTDDLTRKDALNGAPTAFETHARQLRYQAIGSACRNSGIPALLLGHHQDDLVETAIWRLAQGARSSGIQGIREIARIPECHGLYGVSESGLSVKAYTKAEAPCKDTARSSPAPSVSIADGGIFLCRPLLSFPKSRLLDTCHSHDVPYVSDPTNFDPTLTARNAIREMRARHTLPRALQAPRINLLCQANRLSAQELRNISNQFLASRCRIIDFNWDAGSIKLRVLTGTSSNDTLPDGLSGVQYRKVMAVSLQRISELVSSQPANHYATSSYEPFIDQVFEPTSQTQDKMYDSLQKFTTGGSLFQLCSEAPEQKVWVISRQPFMRGRAPVSHLKIPITPSGLLPPEQGWGYSASLSWTLWDNRFWFRLSATSNKHYLAENRQSYISIAIRAYQPSDITRLLKSEIKSCDLGMPSQTLAAHQLKNLFRRRGSAKGQPLIRSTIPVFVHDESPAIEEARNEIGPLLTVPTLDFPFTGTRTGPNQMKIARHDRQITLNWEWQYKMVDFEAVQLMGISLS